jgi:hypothetical protein
MTQDRWTNTMQSIGSVEYAAAAPADSKHASTEQTFRCSLYDKLAAKYPNALCAGYLMRDRDDKINRIEMQVETDRELGFSIVHRLLWKEGVPSLAVERADQTTGLGHDVVQAGVHYNYMVQTLGPGAVASISVYAD